MEPNFKRINLKHIPLSVNQRGEQRKFLKKLKPFLLIFSLIIIVMIIWSFFNSSNSVFQYVIKSATNPLKSTNDRVNVLLLGNAGGTHDGPELTDSIIVASYHLKSNKVTLISIPRDLWLEEVSGKVNSAYEIGEQRPEGGLKYAEDKIDDILGIPIHYGVRLDFNGFAKAIDLVDGVDVEVPKTFDDYNYPITGKEDDLCGLKEKEMELSDEQAVFLKLKPGAPNPTALPDPDSPKKKYKVLVDDKDKIATEAADFSCRFEHIRYDKGKSRMNGETALKFVRSRMGTNGEGSDFARSRRQQLVLQAFRDKVLSLQTLINPQKITGLLSTFGKSIETDIEKERYLDFYNLVKKQSGASNIVLGDLGGGKSVFVVGVPSKYGGFVLIPPDEDYNLVKDFVKQKLEEDEKVENGKP